MSASDAFFTALAAYVAAPSSANLTAIQAAYDAQSSAAVVGQRLADVGPKVTAFLADQTALMTTPATGGPGGNGLVTVAATNGGSVQLPSYPKLAAQLGQAQAAAVASQAANRGPARSLNFDASNYASARYNRNAVQTGAGSAGLAVLGDSTTAGLGGGDDGAWQHAAARRTTAVLAQLLSKGAVPAIEMSQFGISTGDYTGSSTNLSLYNPRVTWTGTNWIFNDSDTGAGGGFWTTNIANSPINFAADGTVDTFNVYYVKLSGAGTINFKIDGSASNIVVGPTSVNSDGATSVGVATLKTYSGASHAVNISAASTTRIYVIGVEAYNSAVNAFRLYNLGNSGRKVADFAAALGGITVGDVLAQLQPRLTIVDLGLNDEPAYQAASDKPAYLTTWSADLTTIVTRASAYGSVLLVQPPQRQDVTDLTYAAFRTARMAVAVATGCAVLDLGERFGSYAKAAAQGWYRTGDPVHMNAGGYGDIASVYAEFILGL